MGQVYRGRVLSFNDRPDRWFGFVKVIEVIDETISRLREVFFHFDAGRFPEEGRDAPQFSNAVQTIVNGEPTKLRFPRPGDIIVFELDRAYRASPWTFAELWDPIVERIADRWVYRMWEIPPGVDPPIKVLWEGSDLSDLLQKYPLPKPAQRCQDPANGFAGCIAWERRRPELLAAWEICEDPRPLPEVLKVFQQMAWR